MKLKVRPITPEARLRVANGPAPKRSQFMTMWSATKELLETELRHLGVKGDVVLQLDITESDIRIDDNLRASARPASPVVAISVESRNGPLLFVCNRFNHWQDNTRAIALGLEALRKVDRYGITQSEEQYRGFRALPGTVPAPTMTVEEAAAFILKFSGEVESPGNFVGIATGVRTEAFYRLAAKNLHPDVEGGDEELFKKLGEAKSVIDYVTGRSHV